MSTLTGVEQARVMDDTRMTDEPLPAVNPSTVIGSINCDDTDG